LIVPFENHFCDFFSSIIVLILCDSHIPEHILDDLAGGFESLDIFLVIREHRGNDLFWDFGMHVDIVVNGSQSFFKVRCLFEIDEKLDVVNDCHVLDHALANGFLNELIIS
jgi:hypothetical protein